MAGSEKTKGKRAVNFICGVPTGYCTGRRVGDKRDLPYGKYHSDQAGCKSCMSNYLVKQGYVKVQANTWDPGGDLPFLVLSKKCMRVKPGKSRNSFMAQPLRVRDALPAPRALPTE